MLADYYSAVLKHPLLRAACLEGKLEFKVFFSNPGCLASVTTPPAPPPLPLRAFAKQAGMQMMFSITGPCSLSD